MNRDSCLDRDSCLNRDGMPRKKGLTSKWVPFSFYFSCSLFCFSSALFVSACAPGPGAQASRSAEPSAEGPAQIVDVTESLATSAKETCFNGLDDNKNGLLEEGCDVHQGGLQFVVAWQEDQADLDLFVTDPFGQVAEQKGVTEAGLTRSSDCPTDDSECHGQNYENVYLDTDEIHPGRYLVRVRAEELPPGTRALSAQLGVRLPRETRAFALTFSAPGQETIVSFQVPESQATAPSETESTQPPHSGRSQSSPNGEPAASDPP